jgi:pimeloyl-ACP methyl ester carboxylesterase
VLALGLLALLGVELAIYAWVAIHIADAHGPGAAVLVVGGLAVALRVALVGVSYAISLATRGATPEPDARPHALLVEFVKEVVAFTACFTVLQPFVRLFMGPPGRTFGPEGGTPLLLVHGYLCNRGLWWHMVPKLTGAGYRVHTLDLEPPFGDLDDFGRQVAQRIDEMRSASGGRPMLLVGHSMGGLAIRAALRVRGSTAGILGIVSLGTPHGGTSLAPWGFGLNALNMRLSCQWLERLAKYEGGAFRVPVVSIYSTHDNFVSPPQSARLRGASHVAMPAVGHLTMCLSSRVEAKLVASLRSIEGGARTSGA